MRRKAVRFVIGHAGLVPARLAERLRNLANYTLGAGTATLGVEHSGEVRLLRHLASNWPGPVTVMDGAHHVGGQKPPAASSESVRDSTASSRIRRAMKRCGTRWASATGRVP